MVARWQWKFDYRGVAVTLRRDGDQYEYYVDRKTGGMGYLFEAAARRAAEKAVDRKLARERAKA